MKDEGFFRVGFYGVIKAFFWDLYGGENDDLGEEEERGICANSECKTPDACRISPNGGSRSTFVYYPPVWDGHGNNLNPDRNVTSWPMKCSTCGREWVAKW